jgi:hypothetical protein
MVKSIIHVQLITVVADCALSVLATRLMDGCGVGD